MAIRAMIDGEMTHFANTLKRFRTAGLLMLACLPGALPAGAQGMAGPAIELSGVSSVDRAAAGSKLEVALVMKIPAPFHVNAHVPSEDYLVPTALTLQPSPGLTFGPVRYPEPLTKTFPFSKKPLRVHEGRLVLRVPVTVAATAKTGPRTLRGEVRYQACNESQCFIPRTRPVTIPITIAPKGTKVKPANTEIFAATTSNTGADPPLAGGTTAPLSRGSTGDAFADQLMAMNPLVALGVLFLLGLGLNATPCVWPVIPITVSYFGGQSGGKRRQTFVLALFYVLGMAVMYSTLGVIAALGGKSFGFAFQNPWVVGAISLFFMAMALSMFGLFELRPPAFIANRAQARRGPLGAMSMGLIVGVVSAPCTGPVVTALLIAIAVTTRQTSPAEAALRGFVPFFTLALGLGSPYLLLGWFTGATRSLPRSGPWTEMVKHVFGLIMLGAALYFSNSLMPRGVFRVLFPAYFLAAGVFLLFAERELATTRGMKSFKLIAGLATAVFGIWSLVGVGLKTETIASPVQWAAYSPSLIDQAKASGKPVIIDFFADWCVPCKELDENTFSDPRVAERFKAFSAVKANLTRESDPQVASLRQQYSVVGVPTVVFLGLDGQERRELRLTGFVPPGDFLQRMQKAAGASVASR
jgi:thiol:disulfide interchange protein DsbD